MPDIMTIVPSRNRPSNAKELLKTWRDTTRFDSEVMFAVDDNDSTKFQYPVAYTKYAEPMKMAPCLNHWAVRLADSYPIIGFLGDDHRFRTWGWEDKVINAFEAGAVVVYGNDLLRGPELPTAVFVDSIIIKTLGYMVPPGLQHMYCDDAWLKLGTELDAITYLDDVIIEHMHFTNGKAENDALYQSVNNAEVMQRDARVYESYLELQLAKDLEKLRAVL